MNKKTQNNDRQNGGKQKYAPFITVDDIPEDGKVRMDFLGNVRTLRSDYGEKIVFDVMVNKKKFAFGIKHSNPGFRQLLNNLCTGQQTFVQRDTYNDNEYIKVVGGEGNRRRS